MEVTIIAECRYCGLESGQKVALSVEPRSIIRAGGELYATMMPIGSVGQLIRLADIDVESRGVLLRAFASQFV